MNNKEFKRAFDYLVEEKEIPAETIIEAMGNGLVAAYKKETGEDADIKPEINTENGIIKLFKRMTVVEELENEDQELCLEEAIEIKPDAQIGDIIETEVTPDDFGRVAISVAKQVVQIGRAHV